MAIGTPVSLGTQTTSGGSFNTNTITLTTSAAIVAADLVVVDIQIANTSVLTVSSVSDGTNTYSKAVAQDNAGTDNHEIWYVANAAAKATSSTITVTMSGSGDSSNGATIEAFRVTGITATTPLDQTQKQSATTASPTVTTGTLSQAVEIAFGASWRGNGTPTYTEASGFSNLVNALTVGNGNGKASVAYQIVAATTALTYAPTWSTSGRCQTLIATFKGSTDANVNVTGVSGTGAAGTVVPTVSPTTTGVSASGAAGSVAITLGPQLVGVAGTGQVGSLIPSPFTFISGVTGTGFAGDVTVTKGPQPVGVAGIGIAGDVFPIPPAPRNRPPLLIPQQNGVPASLWLGSTNGN
jgi:hypothetical protein